MGGDQLIQEWQDILKQKYKKDVSKCQLLLCILRVSKRHSINIEETIIWTDKFLMGERECAQLGSLANFNNSCYMDSVLFSLLAIPNSFIDKHILHKKLIPFKSSQDNIKCPIDVRKQIQQELVNLKKSIMKGERLKCINFRALLGKCKRKTFEDFSGNSPRDADEFLKYIFDIFEVEEGTNTAITYVTNKLGHVKKENTTIVDKIVTNDASPIFDINYQSISKTTTLDKLIKKVDDSGRLSKEDRYKLSKDGKVKYFQRRLQYNRPTRHDYFIVNLERQAPYQEFLNTKVIPEETLSIGNKILRLFAIVIWDEGHYTSMLKCKEWHYYNDLVRDIKNIGTYKEMLSYNENIVQTNGTLFFYT